MYVFVVCSLIMTFDHRYFRQRERRCCTKRGQKAHQKGIDSQLWKYCRTSKVFWKWYEEIEQEDHSRLEC